MLGNPADGEASTGSSPHGDASARLTASHDARGHHDAREHHAVGSTVVLGGTGFVGSAITRALLGGGHGVSVVSRGPSRRERERVEGATVLQADATDVSSWAHLLDDATEVVYSVGALSPLESNLDPFVDVHQSLNPLLCLLEELRHRPHVTLSFLSSGGTVYGNPRGLPVPEHHPTDPITSYGVLKLAAEKYIGMYRMLYGVDARVLRVANAYGPGQPVGRGQGVIGAFIDSVLRGEPVRIFGDGHTVRDYIHVDDIGRAVAGLMQVPCPPVVNIGTGVGTSLLGVHEILEEVIGRPVPIEFLEARAFDVHAIVLDISPLRTLTGLAPLELPTGLEQTWLYEASRRSH